MDSFLQKRIIQEAMQLRFLKICNELKLFFKFSFYGKSWNLFFTSVLVGMNLDSLLKSKVCRRNAIRYFIKLTKFPEYI